MPRRLQQIIDEIKAVDADIFCLREGRKEVFEKIKGEISEYRYGHHHTFDNGYQGLAVLSRSPSSKKSHTRSAVLTTCEYETYLVVNVHLPSDNITREELDIVNMMEEIDDTESDYSILTGDFNCSDSSSVHPHLTGQRTPLDSEADPRWYDLAEVHADITDSRLKDTLDLRNNPRWEGEDVAYTSSRVDRIYIRDTYPRSPKLLTFREGYRRAVWILCQ